MAKTKEKAPKLPAREEVTDRVTPALTHADRCDRCSAQALVRVLYAFSVLDFCGHHFAYHEAALAMAGFITDQDVRGKVA